MPRTSFSKNEPPERPWLQEEYENRKQKTIDLGKITIDQLVKEKKNVSYNSISQLSKEIDPDGQGIHPNTVRRNEKLYEYYRQHSKTYAKKKVLEERDKAYQSKPKLKRFEQISPHRNSADVRRRYNRLTKGELIERLIQAEEYIAEQNDRWLSAQFSHFE